MVCTVLHHMFHKPSVTSCNATTEDTTMSMKQFVVKFEGVIEAESEEEAYADFLDYLAECVRYGDVTTFDFVERKAGEGEVQS